MEVPLLTRYKEDQSLALVNKNNVFCIQNNDLQKGHTIYGKY